MKLIISVVVRKTRTLFAVCFHLAVLSVRTPMFFVIPGMFQPKHKEYKASRVWFRNILKALYFHYICRQRNISNVSIQLESGKV
jgi:hypothetical protein